MNKVRQLPRTLYRKARQDEEAKFYSVYDKLWREDVLWEAWRQVKANRGAPGVDGESIERIVLSRREGEMISRLGQALRAKTYRFHPVRRVDIPKPKGGTRPLGIATVEDRVVQTAMKLVFEPILEADFHDCSYGYRPKRDAKMASLQIREDLYQRAWSVVEIDFQSYFTTIPHGKLMTLIRRTGSPHNVVQTVKTTTGSTKLLVPLRDLSSRLNKYLAKGKLTHVSGLVNQPIGHIIDHYNGVMRGWHTYYQLAENVGRLDYARYVLQYSLAKTLAHKQRLTVAKVFSRYGKPIRFTKPNGRAVCFFNEPLTQVKKAQTKDEVDEVPNWGPRRTKTRLWDSCAICGSRKQVEMHHVRHIRKRGETVRGFSLYLAAINRKQLPVCHVCHRDIHRGKYDGESLTAIEERLQAITPVA